MSSSTVNSACLAALRSDWYVREIEAALDLDQPGIYEWRIEGVGVYVGKALRLISRLRAYPNNVRRMLQGLHWHGDPTREYRPIHHALRDAHDAGTVVVVCVLEVCAPEVRSEREQYWIKLRRAEVAAGGAKVLNAWGGGRRDADREDRTAVVRRRAHDCR